MLLDHAMQAKKPRLFLLPGDQLTQSSLIDLHTKLTAKRSVQHTTGDNGQLLARQPRASGPIAAELIDRQTLSAIPIRQPYIDWILDGSKTWEIRSRPTKKIGPVALIQSGSGTVVGVGKLAQVVALTSSVALANANRIHISREDARGLEGMYAWILEDIVRLSSPVSYHHKPGAVTWVRLDAKTTRAVIDEAIRSRELSA